MFIYVYVSAYARYNFERTCFVYIQILGMVMADLSVVSTLELIVEIYLSSIIRKCFWL